MAQTCNEPGIGSTDQDIGFIGLGVMGQPMALNLAASGIKLVVWNRSAERTEPLRQAGARVANSVMDVFARTRIVFLMLVNEDATDEVLCRGSSAFAELVANHTVISMGSTAPSYSKFLGADVERAGGRFLGRQSLGFGEMILTRWEQRPVVEFVDRAAMELQRAREIRLRYGTTYSFARDAGPAD